jgi:urocanate hydratase
MEYLRPQEYEMKAHPLSQYPAKCVQAKAVQLMIMNNLDKNVAQYPDQLITYGGNGSVFSNWAQYHLTMNYLSEMEEDQTLVMYSGHPMGLFPSHKDAPRVVIVNGLMIPNYSSKELYEKYYAMGVTMYGQMTAGSYCYIGPQGIVHGTTLTILNAGRKYLGTEDMTGKVFVSAGLGGMSGAQPKAGKICGCISVIAEVNEAALMKRYNQGWVQEVTKSVQETIYRIKQAKENNEAASIAYHGNVIELWEALAKEDVNLVDLGSDQTSLHDPYGGGYYPVQLSYTGAKEMISSDPEKFKQLVQESLRRQVEAINTLVRKGMKFWDYGNSFLLEASRAGADIMDPSDSGRFKYPSYVEDIMGDIFSLGFGPFRWICTSGSRQDLTTTDRIAEEVIRELMNQPDCPETARAQYLDNLKWIQSAEENNLVVGSEARILYADTLGRATIALRLNKAIRDGQISAPIVLSRDHHDVSGTDSPYRETSNITDGSKFTADMAVHTALGNACRGATWVALHNGGGVGWGEVMNGGFGLVLDGSEDSDRRAKMMIEWDVINGLSRRCWSGHPYAEETIRRLMGKDPKLKVTLPYHVEEGLEVPSF